jgi:hypothetical protein
VQREVSAEELLYPLFEYHLDESDPDIVVLRRQDDAFVAAFSARGATRQGIVDAARKDYRDLLRVHYARHAQNTEDHWSGTYLRMARVLVTLLPLMYREAIALVVESGRPGLDVRVAPPEDSEVLLDDFRPHLLIHNDTAEIAATALSGVPYRVEVLYSDSMNALIHGADGGVSEIEEVSTTMLLRVVDEATELASRHPPW